jgi:hypothetical protein
MTSLNYLRAKTAEYAVVLSKINKQLDDIKANQSEHEWLVKYLQKQLMDAEILHKRLHSIVEIGNTKLLSRALAIVHDIAFTISVTNYHYLPALQKESQDDLALRKLLLLSAKQRCGFFWLKDIAVNLGGQLAILPKPTEAPVIIAPLQQASSLLEMPGLYHELGHDVFERFREDIGKNLESLVHSYFNQLRNKSGLKTPDQKLKRNSQIDEALQYWSEDRLNEIFCDIFGTFACGAAHYISCVDMSFQSGQDPFNIDLSDEHPPLPARVYACYKSMTLNQQKTENVVTIEQAWQKYIKDYDKDYEYNLMCSDELLDMIVNEAILNIIKFLPNAHRYTTPVPYNPQAQEIPPDAYLEDVLNWGVDILLNYPEQYQVWEAKAFKTLGFS